MVIWRIPNNATFGLRISIATIIIQLAAGPWGWVPVGPVKNGGTPRNRPPNYIKILEYPERYRIECMIAVGYKGEEKLPYKEEELHLDKLHFNRF